MNLAKSNFSCVYIYLRFSSSAQSEGYSLERQRELAQKHLTGFDLKPGTPVQWLEDPGFSAFTGDHMKKGELGKFLKRVRTGELQNGLFLCESVSRASRQGALPLLATLNSLMDSGFTVQFLDHSEPFNKESIPQFLGTMLAVRADLAREESGIKSVYAKSNWDKRRKIARNKPGEVVFTSECPRWLRVENGRYVPIQERVDSIKEIFSLARDGWGISKLIRYANESNLPAPGKKGTWHTSLVQRVLTNRGLIGVFQPHIKIKGKRVPDGNEIANFYPVVIEEDLFYSVQAIRSNAMRFPTRRDDNNFNYLMGIGACECGSSLRRMNKNSGAQAGYALYGCANRQRATTKCRNINARTFDFQFVGFACDNIPAMLAVGVNPQEERLRSLEAQLDEIQRKKSNALSFVEANPDLHNELGVRLRNLATEKIDISRKIADLNFETPPPPGFTFGQAIEVFLPAYLDVFVPGSGQAADAYRARSIFLSRIRESVAKVKVSSNRTWIEVTLKNGAVSRVDLETSMKFGSVENELESTELAELGQKRMGQLKMARRISNAVEHLSLGNN